MIIILNIWTWICSRKSQWFKWWLAAVVDRELSVYLQPVRILKLVLLSCISFSSVHWLSCCFHERRRGWKEKIFFLTLLPHLFLPNENNMGALYTEIHMQGAFKCIIYRFSQTKKQSSIVEPLYFT